MPTAAAQKKDFVFNIQGLDCPHCASELESAVRALSGIEEAVLRFPSGVLRVRGAVDETAVIRLIRQSGYQVSDAKSTRAALSAAWWKTPRALSSFLSVAFLCCALLADQLAVFDARVLYLAALLSGGWMTAISAFWSLRRKQIDMNTLMLIAVFGALWLGDWGEAASVVVLFAFGNTLQAYSLAKTNRSLEALFSAAPDIAWRLENGSPRRILPEELLIGDLALIQAGERIPADGIIQSGQASLNEAAITGESLPVEKGPGAFVYAGSWATDASLTIEVTQKASSSTLARIRQLVLNAQEGKTRSQLFIERFAKLYTPIVVGAATLLTAIPWMFGEDPSVWFYRSLVLLVISCPCALVLATPVAMTAALGQASGRGMLIKSGEYLEAVGKTKAIAFDKTGTLSYGELSLSGCFPAAGVNKAELLQTALNLEAGSTHPIAAALRASGVQPSGQLPTVTVVPGLGLTSEEDGRIAAIGNVKLLQRYGLSPNQLNMPIDERSLTVYVIKNRQLLGGLQFQDIVRPESSAVLEQLRALGVENLSMLTGDQAGSANAFAQVRLKTCCANLARRLHR